MKIEINVLLKRLLTAIVVSLVLLGCATVIGKSRREVEMWLIDFEDPALYRVTADNNEKYIPIKNNRAMQDFVCLHTTDFHDLLMGFIDGK